MVVDCLEDVAIGVVGWSPEVVGFGVGKVDYLFWCSHGGR